MFFEIPYALVSACLAIYGLNALILTFLRTRRNSHLAGQPLPADQSGQVYDWPMVTVQLPIYNERFVVERLLTAVGELDYPADRLQIQVLDDSSDCTTQIIARSVSRLRARGLLVHHHRRDTRRGFKGGALATGMDSAVGDFIAIFDADFLPDARFLKEALPPFFRDHQLGCLQARWGHLNSGSSEMTRSQATGIDGHFVVEQTVRSQVGAFLNFNGTAGVWRRDCILASGGWQCDTLTEDLDLSYRAQLRGWRIQFQPDLVVPGELPAEINAYKRQQFRWAKGSIQTAKKLLAPLWRSNEPWPVKLQGTLHLTGYGVHPLMQLNFWMTPVILASHASVLKLIPYLTLATIGPLAMYWLAMRVDGVPPIRRVPRLFTLTLLGMGMSVNNTRAVVEALLGVPSPFLRTPKYDLRPGASLHRPTSYALPHSSAVWLEALLAIIAVALGIGALKSGLWGLAIWMGLYAAGYGYIAILGMQRSGQRPHRTRQQTPTPRTGASPIPKRTS